MLNPDQQKALAEIGAGLRSAEDAARDRELDAGYSKGELKQVLAELMAEVKAGEIDVAKLDAHEASIGRSEKARHAREADALNRVQRVLEPGQRAAVAAAVRAEESKFAPKSHTGDAETERPQLNWSRIRFESYMNGLGLDAEQQKKVDAILAAVPSSSRRDDEGKEREALLAAFEKDGFDASRFSFGEPRESPAALFSLARFLVKVVAVLTPEQKGKLSEKLVEPEPRKPRRGAGAFFEDDEP